MPDLVLSLFPGVGLLDMAFREQGFCVVAGPDKLLGGDVRDFVGVPGRFDGLVGGPPCQGFSAANRERTNPDHHSVVNSRSLVREFVRIVHESQPRWFVMENVPSVPDVRVAGYEVQRFALSDAECGGRQIRNRHFQFGHIDGWRVRPERVNCRADFGRVGPRPEAITTKPVSKWSNWSDQCRKQGLDTPIQLPGFTRAAKFRAVGNGVSLNVGRVLAAAVKCAGPAMPDDCPCGCGRILRGRKRAATATCRKTLQLDRERARAWVDLDGYHPERDFAAV